MKTYNNGDQRADDKDDKKKDGMGNDSPETTKPGNTSNR